MPGSGAPRFLRFAGVLLIGMNAAAGMPLHPQGFVRNDGQWSAERLYVATMAGGAVALTRDAIVLAERAADGGLMVYDLALPAGTTVAARGRRPEYANYFLGSRPDRWRTRVPCFEQVTLGVAPGVTVVLGLSPEGIVYDVVAAPGADLEAVRFTCRGVSGLALGRAGELVLHTPRGPRVHTRPRAFATDAGGGRREVPCVFRLLGATTFGFACDVDRTAGVVIDPSVVFATYLGGSAGEEATALAQLASGGYVCAGTTTSGDFPTTAGVYDGTYNGTTALDVFVAKLNGTGSALAFATYLGGAEADESRGIALGPNSQVVLVGSTASADFPTTSNAYDVLFDGSSSPLNVDAFVTELAADGTALLYSTYLGGGPLAGYDGDDGAIACTTDAAGVIYAFGSTNSLRFPTTAGAYDQQINNLANPTSFDDVDLFIAKIDPSLSGTASLVASTYLGAELSDGARAIALDAQGNVCLAACTNSGFLPVTIGSGPGSAAGGFDDAYVARLAGGLQSLQFACYLGGSWIDDPTGIAVGPGGDLYVCGVSHSTSGFFTSAGAHDTTGELAGDAFVTRVDPTLTVNPFVASTLFGGSAADVAKGVHVNAAGQVFVVGDTASADLPLAGSPIDVTLNGATDAFVGRFNPSLTALVFSTYFGGNGAETTWSSTFRNRPAITLAGRSTSTDLATGGAHDSVLGGGSDAFIAKLELR